MFHAQAAPTGAHQRPKTGVKPGATPNAPDKGGPKRPVEEEGVFGGAERTKDQRISSDRAEP